MLFSPLLALAVFGSLALLALWATWHDYDLRPLGIILAAGFATSNILHATVSLESLPGPYSFVEVLIAVAAFYGWAIHRMKRLIAIVALNLASIGVNIAFALNFPPNQQQVFVWEVTTNAIFAGECLFAAWVGIAHGYRTGRFATGFRSGRRAAGADAAREAKR
jgi:hypothetical protein